MRVLVTGATGFIGHNIVRDLLKRGDTVKALVHSPAKLDRLGKPRPGLEIVVGDILNPDTVANLMNGVDAIIHLAAVPLEKGRNQTYEQVNHQGTTNLVNAAVKAGVTRFIHFSQNEANLQNASPFIRSKGQSN